MTDRLLPSEICPRCDGKVFRQAAQALRDRTQMGGSSAPVRFGFQCPQCRAALTVSVLTTTPVTLHFALQSAGGQP